MHFVIKPVVTVVTVVAVVAFIACVCAIYKMMIKRYCRNQNVVKYDYMKDMFINSVSQGNHYMNYGLWLDDTTTLMEANNNLVAFAFNKSGLQHKKHMKVLDVGCGYGEQDIQWFKQMDDSCTIHAIDISEAQIKHAIERNNQGNQGNQGNIVFEVCDVKNIRLKFNKHAFDVIFSIESAFHYPNRTQFFEHANELLTSDGRFIITDLMLQNDYNENSWNNKLFIYFFSDFLNIPAQNLISADEWDKQLAAVFDVDEIIDVTEKTFGPYYVHFMHTYVENKRLPQGFANALSSFFCNTQPFSYKIAICKKKMMHEC
jgi:cyclopropane fatty-acyl-phospholipid synthase-like methyltransferase